MSIRTVLGLAILGIILGLPFIYGSRKDKQYRNFRVVVPGVLYRSGQLSESTLERVIREHGIKTVVTLRDSYTQGIPPDIDEELQCKAMGINHFRITPRPWSTPEGTIPADEGVQEFLEVMDQRERYQPVLVHCFAGVHRTGAHVAVFRMEYQDWRPEVAIREMMEVQPRRSTFEEDVLSFLRAYRPRNAGLAGQNGSKSTQPVLHDQP